jgi:DNA ligase (NAD+)
LKDWEETVALLYTNGLVHNYADLYTLTVDHFATRAHGTKISRELGKRVENSKNIPFERVLYALGDVMSVRRLLRN